MMYKKILVPTDGSEFAKKAQQHALFLAKVSGAKIIAVSVTENNFVNGLPLDDEVYQLNQILKEEKDKGNYVIAGGDFNHDIANSIEHFETNQKVPEWVYKLEESDLATGYRFATSRNIPTCRSTDMPYTPNSNYTVVLDGFIVSDNVTVTKVENIAQEDDKLFLYSDHNPVQLNFVLL